MFFHPVKMGSNGWVRNSEKSGPYLPQEIGLKWGTPKKPGPQVFFLAFPGAAACGRRLGGRRGAAPDPGRGRRLPVGAGGEAALRRAGGVGAGDAALNESPNGQWPCLFFVFFLGVQKRRGGV